MKPRTFRIVFAAVLGLCNSAYAATIKTNKGKH